MYESVVPGKLSSEELVGFLPFDKESFSYRDNLLKLTVNPVVLEARFMSRNPSVNTYSFVSYSKLFHHPVSYLK